MYRNPKWKFLHTCFILFAFTIRLVGLHIFFYTWGGRLLQQLLAFFVLMTLLLVPAEQREWSMLALIWLEFAIWGALFSLYFALFSKKSKVLSYISTDVINSLIIIPSVKKQDNKQQARKVLHKQIEKVGKRLQ